MTAQPPRDDNAPDWRTQIAVGRTVEHHHFGRGIVQAVAATGDRPTVTVLFAAPFAVKVLKLRYTTLVVVDPDPADPAAPA